MRSVPCIRRRVTEVTHISAALSGTDTQATDTRTLESCERANSGIRLSSGCACADRSAKYLFDTGKVVTSGISTMARALVTVSILLIGMVVIAHGARELQQVRSGSSGGQVYGAQSTPVTTLSGGGGGGGGGGNSDNAAGPSSGNGNSSNNNDDSGNGNTSNNAAGRTPATLIRKDLGSANALITG
ncbi:g6989 [Coccomyxa viridis]|uniref:G6989 protein n=1 Tax=Coccomyxa viridis TaxID=1274662 RepID=A0ABP1FXX5_9CHLO